MVYGSGEFPRGYLDPNFFTKEASQLRLTPDVAERFKEIVQDLVGQFQKDVEASSDDLISYVKQAGLSGKDITQSIKKAQGKVDAKFKSFLEDTKSHLLQTLGTEHASVINQYVDDLKEQIAPFTKLEDRLRQEPSLKKKLPPKSIFELTPEPSKKRAIKTPSPTTALPSQSADDLAALQALQQQAIQELATKFSIENLISMVAKASKVSLMPGFIDQIANKVMDTTHVNIAGYSPQQTVPPGPPLPTNSWSTLLADDRGAGILGLRVVADSQNITDPKSQIHLSDAKLFDPNAQVDGVVNVPYNTAFSPNVNQGPYDVQSYNSGLAINPSEQYQVTSNGSSAYSKLTPYLMVSGAKEDLIFPPTVVTQDDHSVILLYQTKSGGSMSVPIVRGSPYMTFQYQNTTPYFNSTATPIDLNSIHAYFYKQDPVSGKVSLVENTDGPPWKGGIQGQVFSYSMMPAGEVPGDQYRLYFSAPVTLNPCNYVTETVIPDSVPIPDPNPNRYIHDSTKKPYSTQQLDQFSQSNIATGLQASGVFNGTARVVKLPDATQKSPDLYQQTVQLLDKDAWAIPISGHYDSDGLGKWSYSYVFDTKTDPYAKLNFKNPPPASSGQALIGLLKTDFSYLDGAKVFSDKIYYETIKGEMEFSESVNGKINFYDKAATLAWPDDTLAKLSSSDQVDLATKYITQVVPNLFLPDRHSNQVTYNMGKNVQNAADIAHALWKLSQLNPAVQKIAGFGQALKQATQIAEAGLDDYLTGGLLAFDKTNGMIISQFGQTGEYVDYSNAYGEDHHFAYGYLIRAAAELRQVDPSWFQDPKYGSQRTQMVNLLVGDVFNTTDSNFPRLRMWDPFIGIGRATGLVPPAGNGMNEESTAEDYNCIQGIAMWGQMDGNTTLANQAATMAERVKNAAQAYWQPNSATSIYTDAYAPDAARAFAQKAVSCGVNWDNNATSANFFTPANGDPNIFTIAIEYITGNGSLVDPQAALAAFKYLINQNDSSGFARLFQQNIPLNTPGAVGYYSYISILIPLIAQVSPNAATSILEWFQKANGLQPNVYAYDTGCNYGTIYQQILMARASLKTPDPYPTVNGFNSKLPPLPPQSSTPVYPMDIAKGTALYYLSPWTPPNGIYAQLMPQIDQEVVLLKQQGKYTPQALDAWITNTLIPKYPNQGLTLGGIRDLYSIYGQLSSSGRKLMQALADQVDNLKKSGTYNIQALDNWVQTVLLPSAPTQFPGLNNFDITSFSKIAQINLHSFEVPGAKTLQQYVDAITNWEKQFAAGSPQYQIAEAIKNLIISMEGQTPPKTLKDVIAAIDQQIYPDPDYPVNYSRDIYMRYFGLNTDQMQSLSAILSDGTSSLDVPKFTTLDQKYTQAQNWASTPGLDPKDLALAQALVTVIEQYGSNDIYLPYFQKACQEEFIDQKAPVYMNASAAAQAQFQVIVGLTPPPPDPLQKYIDGITAWEKQFPGDAQKRIGDAMIAIIQAMEGQTPPKTLQDVLAAINNQIYADPDNPLYPRDIYIRYFGLSNSQIQTLSQSVFGGSLTTPPFTTMDQKYTQAQNWFQTPGLPPKDLVLAEDLVQLIEQAGSNDANLGNFQKLCQNLIDQGDPDYTNASPAAQAEFRAIVGLAPPGPDPLQKYVDAISNWEKQFAVGSPQYQIAEAMKTLITSMEGKTPPNTLKDVIAAIDSQIYPDPEYPVNYSRDIYMRYFGLNVDQMKSLSSLLSDGTVSLDVPPFTTMDQKYTQAQNWASTPGLDPKDLALAQALVTVIEEFGSEDIYLPDFQKLCQQDFIDGQAPVYMNASYAAQVEFCTIVGLPRPPDPLQKYIDGITAWEKQFPGASQQLIGDAMIKIIQGMEGKTPPKTLQDVIAAINQQIIQDPSRTTNQQDIYMRFFGLTADQIQALSQNVLEGSLTTPQYTTMDQKYAQVEAWLNDPTISGPDKALATWLANRIALYGSSNANIPQLQQDATALQSDPLYTNASAGGQTKFDSIVGIAPPPPPPTGLDAWDKEITQYLQNLNAEFAQFILDLGLPPGAIPTTVAGWEKLAKRDDIQANKLAADIALAQQNGNWQALQAKWGLPPGDNQAIQKEANDRLNAYKDVMKGCSLQSGINLFTATLQEIKQLEASHGTVADLKKWAATINLANYPYLSDADKAEFNKLLA